MTSPTNDPVLARFPGASADWARFDGPAGTQMVDTAIEAMREWSASGKNANGGGFFEAAHATDNIVATTRSTLAHLLGAPSETIVLGPNMTTLTFAFTRALARDWNEGDRIVGTRLDHDANVSTWRTAGDDCGVEHVLAEFNPHTGRLETDAIEQLLNDRTQWVTVTGASNLIGTMPDLKAIVEVAHAAGAKVFVDAVALVPHRAVDIAAIGCDALATSAYKWYGPHAAALWIAPEILETLNPYKVRPASNTGPKRLETGTPNYEGLAGMNAAAHFMLEQGVDTMAHHEASIFASLLDGLQRIKGVRLLGPLDLVDRAPTVSFLIEGRHPDDIAQALADQRIAVWSGDSYAVEVAAQLGVSATGVVRAGVVRYVTNDDVDRLLDAVERIASTPSS